MADIKHFDIAETGGSRVVFSNGVAYFTGHASPFVKTLAEQTAGVCKRYEELFAQFGLKKENLIYANAYLKDVSEEEEFAREFKKWLGGKGQPAGVTVEAMPYQGGELGDNIRLELALIVATDEDADIQRLDAKEGGSRAVIHNGVAYFTGHVFPKAEDIEGQTAGVLGRYDELFAQFGLKKENVLSAHGYLKTVDDYKGLGKPYAAYFGETPPAGVVVEASPTQVSPLGDNLRLELAFLIATDDSLPIKRLDVVPGMSRVVEYNGFAYFTGHSAKPGFATLKEQTEAVLARYDELFEQFGYKKENIVMMNGYLADIDMYKEFAQVMRAWRGEGCHPAGVVVQAKPGGDNNLLELQFIVAID